MKLMFIYKFTAGWWLIWFIYFFCALYFLWCRCFIVLNSSNLVKVTFLISRSSYKLNHMLTMVQATIIRYFKSLTLALFYQHLCISSNGAIRPDPSAQCKEYNLSAWGESSAWGLPQTPHGSAPGPPQGFCSWTPSGALLLLPSGALLLDPLRGSSPGPPQGLCS